MSIDPYKREILYRKAQGNLLFDKYENKIKNIINIDVDKSCFLSLIETDKLINGLKNKETIQCDKVDFLLFPELSQFIKERVLCSSYYLLIDDGWKYCGAYKVKSGIDLNDNFNFDASISDEIRIIGEFLEFQFQIDYDDKIISCQFFKYL